MPFSVSWIRRAASEKSAAFGKTPAAPKAVAWRIFSSVANAVTMMTGTSGRALFSLRRVSIPSIPGMRTSRKTTSGGDCATASSASVPLAACATSYPWAMR